MSNRTDTSLIDTLFAGLLYILPHHLLSQVMFWITRCEWRPFKDFMIRQAIKLYNIDMHLAAEPDPSTYRCFNDFFTRALRPDARPLATEKDAILCPVDGTVSQAGQIEGGRIFQAKGHDYSLEELVGGDEELAKAFADGSFATIYLSPKDYHRIHIPLTGKLKKMLHIPGRLFSVSPSTTRTVPRLFSRNERIVNLFETEAGPVAVIMVGAIFVASMDTVWTGTVAPLSRSVRDWSYTGETSAPPEFERGAEIGRFNMGSTVILLFGKDVMEWSQTMQADNQICMGERIGTIL
ncbi:Phosphatidylserine decarboxylase [hydrothermal vent metagenome]|uniref:phosphatidylserine decarboxylase n=1 Tax=hydrothermal vent metagenome TaxID=652676 RepID=A0A3B1B3E4_9ZZZZ